MHWFFWHREILDVFREIFSVRLIGFFCVGGFSSDCDISAIIILLSWENESLKVAQIRAEVGVEAAYRA